LRRAVRRPRGGLPEHGLREAGRGTFRDSTQGGSTVNGTYALLSNLPYLSEYQVNRR
jgi:hypothetical protein